MPGITKWELVFGAWKNIFLMGLWCIEKNYSVPLLFLLNLVVYYSVTIG